MAASSPPTSYLVLASTLGPKNPSEWGRFPKTNDNEYGFYDRLTGAPAMKEPLQLKGEHIDQVNWSVSNRKIMLIYEDAGEPGSYKRYLFLEMWSEQDAHLLLEKFRLDGSYVTVIKKLVGGAVQISSVTDSKNSEDMEGLCSFQH